MTRSPNLPSLPQLDSRENTPATWLRRTKSVVYSMQTDKHTSLILSHKLVWCWEAMPSQTGMQPRSQTHAQGCMFSHTVMVSFSHINLDVNIFTPTWWEWEAVRFWDCLLNPARKTTAEQVVQTDVLLGEESARTLSENYHTTPLKRKRDQHL